MTKDTYLALKALADRIETLERQVSRLRDAAADADARTWKSRALQDKHPVTTTGAA